MIYYKAYFDCVVGIDPGASGGVACYVDGRATAMKMPKDLSRLKQYLEELAKMHTPLVVLEKLSVRPDDVRPDDKGGVYMAKMFRVQKMIANFEQLKAAIEYSGVPYVLAHPMKWQSALRLRVPGEEKPARKRRYKDVAQALYPEVTATMYNCDALLLMHFGRFALGEMPRWIDENLSKKNQKTDEIEF